MQSKQKVPRFNTTYIVKCHFINRTLYEHQVEHGHQAQQGGWECLNYLQRISKQESLEEPYKLTVNNCSGE